MASITSSSQTKCQQKSVPLHRHWMSLFASGSCMQVLGHQPACLAPTKMGNHHIIVSPKDRWRERFPPPQPPATHSRLQRQRHMAIWQFTDWCCAGAVWWQFFTAPRHDKNWHSQCDTFLPVRWKLAYWLGTVLFCCRLWAYIKEGFWRFKILIGLFWLECLDLFLYRRKYGSSKK